jgi:hypothetical protein
VGLVVTYCFSSAVNKFRQQHATYTVKFLSKWLPVGKQTHRYNPALYSSRAHPPSAQKKTSTMFFVVLREENGKLHYDKHYTVSLITQQPTRNSLIYSPMDCITGSTTQPTPPQHRQKDNPCSQRVKQQLVGTNSSSDGGRQSGDIFNTTSFNITELHQRHRIMVLAGRQKSLPYLVSLPRGMENKEISTSWVRSNDTTTSPLRTSTIQNSGVVSSQVQMLSFGSDNMVPPVTRGSLPTLPTSYPVGELVISQRRENNQSCRHLQPSDKPGTRRNHRFFRLCHTTTRGRSCGHCY